MDHSDQYYRVLDLQPNASAKEVKRAYRLWVKVYHPDRFSDDPEVRSIVEKKLKEVIEAFEHLKVPRSGSASKNSSAKGPEHRGSKAEQSGRGEKDHHGSGSEIYSARDARLIQTIADQLRGGAPTGPLRFVLMLEEIGTRCCETDMAKAIFAGMRGLHNFTSAGWFREIDCAKVQAYLLRAWGEVAQAGDEDGRRI